MSREDTKPTPAELHDADRQAPDFGAMLDRWHRQLSELSRDWDERVAALRRERGDDTKPA